MDDRKALQGLLKEATDILDSERTHRQVLLATMAELEGKLQDSNRSLEFTVRELSQLNKDVRTRMDGVDSKCDRMLKELLGVSSKGVELGLPPPKAIRDVVETVEYNMTCLGQSLYKGQEEQGSFFQAQAIAMQKVNSGVRKLQEDLLEMRGGTEQQVEVVEQPPEPSSSLSPPPVDPTLKLEEILQEQRALGRTVEELRLQTVTGNSTVMDRIAALERNVTLMRARPRETNNNNAAGRTTFRQNRAEPVSILSGVEESSFWGRSDSPSPRRYDRGTRGHRFGHRRPASRQTAGAFPVSSHDDSRVPEPINIGRDNWQEEEW